MTRRKWTKLRRQKPHLFGALPAFEKWNAHERKLMALVGTPRALSAMTAWWLSQLDAPMKIDWASDYRYRLEPIISYGPTPKL